MKNADCSGPVPQKYPSYEHDSYACTKKELTVP